MVCRLIRTRTHLLDGLRDLGGFLERMQVEVGLAAVDQMALGEPAGLLYGQDLRRPGGGMD
jgi:hypothetical protein